MIRTRIDRASARDRHSPEVEESSRGTNIHLREAGWMKENNQCIRQFLAMAGLLVLSSLYSAAQKAPSHPGFQDLPAAPMPQASSNQSSATIPGGAPAPGAPPSSQPVLSLTRKQAEALALKNNPQISAARLLALASQQVTREVRSNLWPTATGDLTGVDAQSGSRITAGALNNPIIYERAKPPALK